eukprot:gene6138-8309_t
MLFGGAAYNNGIVPFKSYIFGEAYTATGEPAKIVSPGTPPGTVTPHQAARGALAALYPLPTWQVVPPADVFRVFEQGGRNNGTGFAEVGLPNPSGSIQRLEEPGRPDLKQSNRGPGTAARSAAVGFACRIDADDLDRPWWLQLRDTVERRRIATELRPGVLDSLGLAAAIEWQAAEFQERTGIQCELKIEVTETMWEREFSTACFRIFQETLTNITRHAHATHVTVSLAQDGADLLLTVRDNGRGITEKEISHPGSIGLMGMKERAAQAGGDVSFASSPRHGTTVTLRVPLAATVILIADDHAVVRHGLKMILAAAFKRASFGGA